MTVCNNKQNVINYLFVVYKCDAHVPYSKEEVAVANACVKLIDARDAISTLDFWQTSDQCYWKHYAPVDYYYSELLLFITFLVYICILYMIICMDYVLFY